MITTFLKKNLFILVIFAIALLLRLYHLDKTLTFLEDEGRDVLISYRMLDTKRPVLLGPQTSTGDMYLGPFYYYFITPALALFNLSPLGPAALIALTGALTSVLMYLIARPWFGTLSAVSASLLYTLMPLPVVFTRNSWNPNLAPLASLILLYFTVKLVASQPKSKNTWNYFFIGVSAGILVQLHYMSLLFLLAVALVLTLYRYSDPKKLLMGTAIGLSGFFLMLSPFIIFEVRNDFVNTRAITRFVEADEVNNIRYTMPLSLWADKVGSTTTRVISSLFGRDALTSDPLRLPITLIFTFALIILLVTYRRLNHGTSTPFIVTALLFLLPLFALGIYQENIHLHYLGFMFPLVYLVYSAGLSHPQLKYLFALLFLASITYSLPQLASYLSSSGTNQMIRAQEVVEYITRDSQGEPYNLVSSPQTNTTPYLYYAAISANPPKNDKQNTLYMICQGDYCNDSNLHSPFIFITGPAHPTLSAYLGHPLYHTYDAPRSVISHQHVSHGVWVAKLLLE